MISPNRRRLWLLATLSIATGLVALAIVSEVTLRFLPVRSAMATMPVNAENPVMRFMPNRRFTYSMDWNLTNVVRGRVNNYGFVNEQDYDSTLTSPLLAVVGDSYVEALMVTYPETLHGRLAGLVGTRGRVYSFGVSGASLAQYLVEADYARATFRPSGLIVVIVGNDFDESLMRYRLGPGHHYFAADSSGLHLARLDYAPSLLRRVLRRSAVVRYLLYNAGVSGITANFRSRPKNADQAAPRFVGNTVANADSERVDESRRVVDAFLAQLPSRSGLDPSRILLVLDGMRRDLYDAADLERAGGSYFDLMRRYVMETATRAGFEVLDMQPVFIERHRRDGTVFEFPRDGHWNAAGHQEAAAAVAGSKTLRRVLGASMSAQ